MGLRMSRHPAKAREGDFLETRKGLIFDVKGLVHPKNRTVAFPRYFPDKRGERKRNSVTYGKVYSLSERYSLLKEKSPEYLVHDRVFDEIICEVPSVDVKKRYDPVEKVGRLRKTKRLHFLEDQALRMTRFLKENADIPWSSIGISGSILTGLQSDRSDIDAMVYGSSNCTRASSVLKELLNRNSLFKRYNLQDLRRLFDFRSKDTAVSFEDFVRTESRKSFQGKFMNTDYFIRFVKDWNEIDEKYGDIQYKNLGQARIKGIISEDSESIFTPCKYRLKNTIVIDGLKSVTITEIDSFRGRFCEQAKTGETVVAQGKVEKVTDRRTNRTHFRLLIGNSPSDHMILI
jgi:predicted nucleotidyltransferase